MSNLTKLLKTNIKRLLAGVGTLALILAGAAAMSAFEAHVINVTATIENALNVSVDALDFGTVFPQEALDQRFNVFLSESFVREDRVDDVDYFIRQKPKCGIPIPQTDPVEYSGFVQVVEDEAGIFVCPEVIINDLPVRSVPLPLLCPYLSKEELTTDGPEENDGSALVAFHGPISLIDWTMQVAQSFDVFGRLAKSEQDTQDTWNIDLKVPCFGEHCAQDWDSFVNGINNSVNPADYIQPIENEHELFGCDLWLEVKGVSLATGNGTLIIQKVLINDDETGSADSPDDFSFAVNGGSSTAFEADGENEISVAPGLYDVVEDAETGYSTSYQNCSSVQVDGGETETCIITNDDNPRSTLFSDGFGVGSTDTTFDEAPVWSEEGINGDDAEKRAAGSDDNTASPDGDRFAAIFSANGAGNNGWICRTMDATGFNSLLLSYYWRGDITANSSTDDGVVEFRVGGICADNNDGTGWTNLQNHDLQIDGSWTTQGAFALPGGAENTSFLLRFRTRNAEDSEDFRVDGISLSGVPN